MTKSGFPLRLLIIIFCLALIPRLFNLHNNLLITYDQGLHSRAIWKIWQEGKISLLGHQTDTDGIHHSPLYYWLMVPLYIIGRGDPVVPAYFQAILQSSSVFLIYILGRRLFNRKVGLYSALIFAVSYGFSGYARWLSNVTPVLPLSLVVFCLLERIIKGRIKLLPFAALIISLITQCNGALGVFLYPLLPFAVYLSWKNFRPGLNLILLTVFAVTIPHLPLLAFELRHGFIISQAIIRFSGSSSTGFGLEPSTVLHNLRTLFNEIYKVTAYGFMPLVWLVIGVAAISFCRNGKHAGLKLLSAFILIPLAGLFLYQRGAIGFFFHTVLPLILVFVVWGLSRLPKPFFRILITLIVVINIFHWMRYLSPENNLTPIGTENVITHTNRKAVIDWIYHQADGSRFSLWIYTIPYILDDPWLYYFTWYGQSVYGYYPDQTGGFGPRDLTAGEKVFLIYEPDYLNSARLNAWHQKALENFGQVVGSFRSGDALVEQRSKIN